ncbi:putative membrane protein [Cricetibacter osteomyelitidis]|uniref:Putative membrane protein n=1 Tax=Cricetibacter osteomyelitidis TaxID=1521931 RepID=A0A4R2T1M5_9PAST|nr:PACE efflux transporter [Cricetibacter osteomyelitidis]TCP96807.1 putative membrane protein [Cricetibacter osteomyelitidis]
MSLTERIFHAILFEIFVVLFTVLLMAGATHHGTGALSGTIIGISVMAMVWNMVFNWAFDKFHTGAREKRSLVTRLLHVTLFEGGLLLATIPFVAWALNISLWEAFVMDIAMTIFVTAYSFVYNYIYDHARAALIARRGAKRVKPA